MKSTRVWISLFAVLLILAASVRISNLREIREAIDSSENRSSEVRYRDDVMTRSDFLWLLVKEQLDPVSYLLIQFRPPALWGLIYLGKGFCGGIIWYWLTLYRAGIRTEEQPPQGERLVVRLVLATASGGIMYLLLYLPAPLMSQFLSVTLQDDAAIGDLLRVGGESELLTRCEVLALLAGVFTNLFFKNLEHAFDRITSKGKDNAEEA